MHATISSSDFAFPQTQMPRVRSRADTIFARAAEAVVLVLVCGSPWAFGGEEPVFEFLSAAALALLSALWAARAILTRRLPARPCFASYCLGGLVLLGFWQLVPLPPQVVAWLSPGLAQLRVELLPAEHELLPGEDDAGPLPPTTLSVYPGSTRRKVLLMLALFLFFELVRSVTEDPAALRRLVIALFINGALLALFGVIQHVSAAPNKGLFWSVPSPGATFFGPFPSRNTYGFYANLVFGCGAGLALSLRGGASLAEWFEEPRKLALCLGLVAVFASLVLCQSRGAFVSFVAGLAVVAALHAAGGASLYRAFPFLLVLGVALLFLAWLGFGWDRSRLSDLVHADALKESGALRASLWVHTLPLARQCWPFGTGLGTFGRVDHVGQPGLLPDERFSSHPHNDYAEYFVDGGATCLVLIVLLIAYLLRCGYRAARFGDYVDRGLAAGAVFGLVSVVVNSSLNSMIHVPAVAWLTAVSCAALVSLDERSRPPPALPASRPLALAAGLLVVMIGSATLVQAWCVYRADLCLVAAYGLEGETPHPVSEESRLAFLEAAESLVPDNARLQVEIGQSHFRLAHEAADAGSQYFQPAAAIAGASAFGCVPDSAGACFLAASLFAHSLPAETDAAARGHLVEAMRHYRRARDLCPLFPAAQVRLAAHANVFARAEPSEAYLRRAQLLLANDPDVWYLGGLHALRAGRPAAALADWRRSLELSDRHLEEILRRSLRLAGAAALEQVVPDQPEALAAAAPLAADPAARSRYVERAFAAYEAALEREPLQPGRRLAFARLLLGQGQPDRARQELATVLSQDPHHVEARKLWQELAVPNH